MTRIADLLTSAILVAGGVLIVSQLAKLKDWIEPNWTLLALGCVLLLVGAWMTRKRQQEREKREAAEGFIKNMAAYHMAGFEPRPAHPWFENPAELEMTVPITDVPSSSWVGGVPSLPDTVGWPVIEGEPAVFRAQIACADLPEGIWGGLGPSTGWLIFFSGAEALGDVAVLHCETLGQPRGTAHAPRWPLRPADPDTRPEGPKYSQHKTTPRQEFTQQDDIPAALSPQQNATFQDMLLSALKDHLKFRSDLDKEPGIVDPSSAHLPVWQKLAQESPASDVDQLIEQIISQDDPRRVAAMRKALTAGYLYRLEQHARKIYTDAPNALPPEMRTAFEPIWQKDAPYERLSLGGPVGEDFFEDRMQDPVFLLRLPTSDLLGWQFSDLDDWGVFIPPEALKARDFSQASGSVSN